MPKRKRSPKGMLYIIWGVIAVLIIGIGSLFLAFALPAHSDYQSVSQATAQHLAQFPAEDPAFISLNQNCNADDAYCFRIQGDVIDLAKPFTIIATIDGHMLEALPITILQNEAYGALSLADFGSGLHLITLQIQDTTGQIYHHTWTENTTDGIVSAPPTLAVPPTYSTSVPPTSD